MANTTRSFFFYELPFTETLVTSEHVLMDISRIYANNE